MRKPQHHANRTAITLLEVLIAIGILSVGLASVFALFPAARHLSGKALNYDRSATLAENAINDFLTRGFHNPRTWVPSPVATSGEWPFAAGGVLTAGWPNVFGTPNNALPHPVPGAIAVTPAVTNVLIFDPLDRRAVARAPTQPPDPSNLFPSLPTDIQYEPIWSRATLTHPVLMLHASPHTATGNTSGAGISHPLEYEPSYGNNAGYSVRLVDEVFRLNDDLAYSLDGVAPDDYPLNVFSDGQLGQRQFQGRFSCLFMLFRVGNTWQAGQPAQLTVVVFRDRDPTRSPIMLADNPADDTWRIGHSASTHPYPMPNALADFRVKDVLKPGTLVYDAGTLSWWKAMYAPNNDDVTSLSTAVASADLVYNQNQCVWTAMGPNASATAPTGGPLFAFPDAVAVSYRQIVLASDDRWSE